MTPATRQAPKWYTIYLFNSQPRRVFNSCLLSNHIFLEVVATRKIEHHGHNMLHTIHLRLTVPFVCVCVAALGVCSSPQEGLQSKGVHGHWVKNYQ